MKRNFEITPREDNHNILQITFKKGFKIQIDKKDKVFVKFVMMLLHYGGGAATYFAPLLGYTDRAFHNIKEHFEKKGIQSLFHGNSGRQNARKITDEYMGKILTLIVQNPTASNKIITQKFNEQEGLQINVRSVENLRNRYMLFKKKQKSG